MNWFVAVVKKYAVFQGRAQRAEYWYFILFFTLFSIVLMIIDMMMGTFDRTLGAGLLSGLFSLALLIPSLAVSVRRLHDTGRTGWWLLIGFIPLVGGIVLLVFMCQDSQPGSNPYGPNPKGLETVPGMAAS